MTQSSQCEQAVGIFGDDEPLRVAAFLLRSLVNGPGLRSVLWVQGCGRRCEGCFNPEFWDFEGGRVRSLGDVAGWMLEVTDSEGITFSGGEPFAQARALAVLARRVREAGKSVVIFTGFTRSEVEAGRDPAWKALFGCADLLICGPYQRDNPSTHPLLSSANQEIVFVTDRYQGYDFGINRKRVEYRIRPRGEVITTGFPKPAVAFDRRAPEGRRE